MRKIIKTAVLAFAAAFCCSAAHRYSVRGLVLKVDQQEQTLLVSHEAIPGYMDAMTMPYHVSKPEELASLKAGSLVAFTLTVDDESSSVSGIHVLEFDSLEREPLEAKSLATLQQALTPSRAAVAIGQRVPDFTLIDQTGQRTTLSAFAGKVVAISLAYTRCPLPDYCFRLSNNFGRLQTRFANRMGADLILLTITFDPEHDTSDVLAKYGQTWHADPKGWHLLTGPLEEIKRVCGMLGSNFWPNEGSVTHSLHTFVIDRTGKLVADIEGNRFSAEQLGDLVQTYF